MLGLLYFWRLEPEKWFDGIIDMIEMYKEKELPFQLFIFGSGSREAKIQELTEKYKNIHFFGRKDLETIKRYKENCQYCLMPSECLETFGLSALTALQRGLTPIGYAKWWLKEFIDHDFDLTHQIGETTGEKLYNMISKLKTPLIKGETKGDFKPMALFEYSKEKWIVNFHALAGKDAEKILIVSDFINKVGGIETYINDVKDLLEPHGYKIELCGGKVPSGTVGKLIKYLGFITGLGNFWEAIKIQRIIKKTQPDVIRYNSIMRYLGRMPIRASKNSSAKKWMMFHDLGYFAPFPSKLEQEKNIKTPLTLKNFLNSQTSKNPLIKLAIIGKYLALLLIKKQLKKSVDTFLVPSNFMVDIVHKSYKIDNEKIKVFPHFIQE